MKKKKEVLLEELKAKLIDVEREIALIKSNYDNITGRGDYMKREPYNMPDMFGVDIIPSDLDMAAYGPVIIDANYVDEKLQRLENESESLKQQIKSIEKEFGAAQRGE